MADSIDLQELGAPSYVTDLARDNVNSKKKGSAKDEIRKWNEIAALRRKEKQPPQPREKVNRTAILSDLLGD